MQFNLKNEVMLITGASSGLGEALALRAGELGTTVISIARNKERLRKISEKISRKGGTAFDFLFDLQDVAKIPDLYNTIINKVKKPPTILVNNVGYQVAGFVQNTPIEVYEKNYRVNTIAPAVLIQCVLPDMLKNKKGIIANVMSSIMYRAFPGVSSYVASKKALDAIHKSLKSELTGTSVKTLYIQPGSFRSNYWKNTDIGDRIKGYTLPSGDSGRDPSYAAAEICKAIVSGAEELNLNTYKDKIGYHLSYWAPRVLDKIIAYKNKKLLDNYPIFH